MPLAPCVAPPAAPAGPPLPAPTSDAALTTVQCSVPLAGVVPPARTRRPAVGAAPDGSLIPAVLAGPG